MKHYLEFSIHCNYLIIYNSNKKPSSLNTHLKIKSVIKMKRALKINLEILNILREDAFLDSNKRLFYSFAFLQEKHFCPLADVFFGSLRSVSDIAMIAMFESKTNTWYHV